MTIGVGKNIPVTITATRLETNPNTGSECIVVEVANDDGSQWWRGYLTDAALERTIDTLRQVGWVPEQHDFDLDSLDGTDLLVGNDARITTEENTYDGKTSIKVAWLNGTGYVGPPVSDDRKASLRARIKALGSSRPAVAEKPRAEETLESAIDDTPF